MTKSSFTHKNQGWLFYHRYEVSEVHVRLNSKNIGCLSVSATTLSTQSKSRFRKDGYIFSERYGLRIEI